MLQVACLAEDRNHPAAGHNMPDVMPWDSLDHEWAYRHQILQYSRGYTESPASHPQTSVSRATEQLTVRPHRLKTLQLLTPRQEIPIPRKEISSPVQRKPITLELLTPREETPTPSLEGKPVDSQWSFQIGGGFIWTQKQCFGEVLASRRMDHEDGSNEDHHKMFPTMSPVPLFQSGSHRNNRLCLQPGESTSENRCLDKKCKVFLSHAGTEKGFVKELHKELQRVYHFGIFFDKDEDSLPKGEQFPQRIFHAAEHCELAIVVMSDEFFARKWPMLELKTFVEAQKTRPELKILPVFYKLSADEFKQPGRQRSYKESWNHHLSSRNISKDANCQWDDVSKVISSTNGIQLQSSEVAMMAEVVKATFKLVRPYLLSDDSYVQGKMRMSEKIQKNFQGTYMKSVAVKASSVCFVGLYGMGGSGKTTMSKVLCNNLMQDFFGKVCHIEFGAHGFLDLCKQLIRCTTNFEEILLNNIADGKALELLQNSLSNQKIFLVLDNVDQASFAEAEVLLKLPFKKGSLILVTARSIVTLEKLNVPWKTCFRLPALQKDEAMALLAYHAGCDTLTFSNGEKETLEKFLDKCCFKVEDWSTREYHPLALKVLGTRVGPDPRKWRKIVVDFKHCAYEKKHPIFSILRSGYDALKFQKHQRMFVDLVLGRSGLSHRIKSYDMAWRFRYLYEERSYGFTFEVLEEFKSNALIEHYNPYSGEILVHDLYREFVQMEVEKEEFQHSRKCCLSGALNQRYKQEHRLRIYKQNIKNLKKEMLCICSDSELLTIEDCPELKSIDVRGMLNLKMLEIIGCPQLEYVFAEGLENLRSIVWKGFKGKYPSLKGLKSLEGLNLISDENAFDFSTKTPRLDLSKCSYLDVLELWNQPPMTKLPDFNFLLNLTILHVNHCTTFRSFLSLKVLVCLFSLQLYDCSSLLEFPSLSSFPLLEILTLEGAQRLQRLTGFRCLTALEFLSLKNASSLEGLPGIKACTNLKGLDLFGTQQIQDFTWISTMLDLEKVNLSSSGLTLVPDCSNLCKLEEFYLNDCPNLEKFKGENVGIGESLRRISMWNCLRLTSLPQLSESALTHLKITHTSIQDIPGVEHCLHLQYLDCAYSSVRGFPDLSNLRSLKRLNVRGCLYLTRLDNIKSLPALEELLVQDCKNLAALPDLSSSNYLMELDLKNCPLIYPSLVKLPASRSVHILTGEDCNDVQTEEAEEADEADEADGIVEEPALPGRTWWKNIVDSIGVTTRWLSN